MSACISCGAALNACGSALDAPLKGKWQHGPFGCCGDCDDLSSVPCMTANGPGICLQYGITERALGGSFVLGTCYSCVLPPCAAYTQRAAIASKTGAELSSGCWSDLALSFCCTPCAILQHANQIGVEAQANQYKISDLLTAPTAQQVDAMKAEVLPTAAAAWGKK